MRLLADLADHPVRLGEDTVTVHASIGLTEARPDDTPKELMRRADLALYAAKQAGAYSWTRHDESMVDRRARDAALADDLARPGRPGRADRALPADRRPGQRRSELITLGCHTGQGFLYARPRPLPFTKPATGGGVMAARSEDAKVGRGES